jgi:hypothetical protein
LATFPPMILRAYRRQVRRMVIIARNQMVDLIGARQMAHVAYSAVAGEDEGADLGFPIRREAGSAGRRSPLARHAGMD